MLDINFIRENLDLVKKAVSQRHLTLDFDRLIRLDEQRRTLLVKVEELRRAKNQAAKNQDIETGKTIKIKLDTLKDELKQAEKNFQELVLQVPNIPLPTVPEGDESVNKIIKKEGEPKQFGFQPKDHVELGEKLDILDIPRAGKVSGTRFAYLKNEGAMLELALVHLAMNTLFKEGFQPVIPPALIKKDITEGLGYWHGGGNENYYFVRDYEIGGETAGEPLDLYLIGTGEHATVPMYSGEVLEDRDLPKKFAAYSPCFRREAGSYGKDTRGILRVHQFDKVEMVEFVRPEDDEPERQKMLSLAEGFMKSLGLPYQVVQLAGGDLGFPAAETIDIETWIPSQNRYRETHSISTTTNFQSRRLNIRYRNKEGQAEYLHILNGTAIAIGRTIITILENYQQEDGSVVVPEVLRPYTDFNKILPR